MTVQLIERPDRLTHEKLLAYVDDLESWVRDLMVDTTDAVKLQRKFGLTPSTAQILMALAEGTPKSFEALHATACRQSTDSETNTIKVQICILRRALRPHGVIIDNIRSFGYQLVSGREVLVEALAA